MLGVIRNCCYKDAMLGCAGFGFRLLKAAGETRSGSHIAQARRVPGKLIEASVDA